MTLQHTVELVQQETASLVGALTEGADTRVPNTSFSQKMPGLQLFWDSTSLGALKVCPQYYKYVIIDGYSPRGESDHLIFGIEFHAALEYYDRLRAEEVGHRDAILDTIKRTLIRTWNPRLNRPWHSDEPNKNRETLVRSILWYLDQFENDPMETIILHNGKPAVELSFRFEAGFSSLETEEEFWFCGHLDKLAKYDGEFTWIVDRKTTKTSLSTEYFARYTPDNQMSIYDLAGDCIRNEKERVYGLIIDACQVLVTGSRFQRGFVTRTPTQRKEWLDQSQVWLRQAEAYAKFGVWPQNDKACNMYSSYNAELNTWKGGCPFKPVCGASPEIRPKLLAGLYNRRTWDPRQTREV